MRNTFYENPFPELDLDDRFYLREQSLQDTEAFLEYYSNPAVSKHILASIPETLSEAADELHYCRDLFHKRRGIYWSLARKADNQIIGAIGLYHNRQHHRAEICYDLHQQFWRQGIMSRAIAAVTDFAFRHMDVYRIEAVTLKENIASIESLKKSGYRHEGSLRNYRYFKNQARDVELLATTLEEQIERLKQSEQHAEIA